MFLNLTLQSTVDETVDYSEPALLIHQQRNVAVEIIESGNICFGSLAAHDCITPWVIHSWGISFPVSPASIQTILESG